MVDRKYAECQMQNAQPQQESDECAAQEKTGKGSGGRQSVLVINVCLHVDKTTNRMESSI